LPTFAIRFADAEYRRFSLIQSLFGSGPDALVFLPSQQDGNEPVMRSDKGIGASAAGFRTRNPAVELKPQAAGREFLRPAALPERFR
jgi:hypothetical protein